MSVEQKTLVLLNLVTNPGVIKLLWGTMNRFQEAQHIIGSRKIDFDMFKDQLQQRFSQQLSSCEFTMRDFYETVARSMSFNSPNAGSDLDLSAEYLQ